MTDFAQTTRTSVNIGPEASPKVPANPVAASKLPVTNPSSKPEAQSYTPTSLTGTPETRPTEQGKKKYPTDVELETNPSSIMPMLLATLGGNRKHGTAALWTRDYFLGDRATQFFEQAHADYGKYIVTGGVLFSQLTAEISPAGFQSMKFAGIGATISPTNGATVVANGQLVDRTKFRPFSNLRTRLVQGGQVMGIGKKLTIDINRNAEADEAIDETDEVSCIYDKPATGKGTISCQFANNPVTGYSAATLRDLTLDPDNQTSLYVYVPYGKGWGMWIRMPAVKFMPGYVTTQGGGIATLDGEFSIEPLGSLLPELRTIWFTDLSAQLINKVLKVKTNVVNGAGGAGDETITFGAVAANLNTPQKVVDFINGAAVTFTAEIERKATETGACMVLRPNPAVVGGDAGATDIRIATTGSDAAAVLGLETSDNAGDAIPGLAERSIIITVMSAIAA